MFSEGLFEAQWPLSLESATSMSIHPLGSPVRVKLVLFLLLLSLTAAVEAQSADTQPGIVHASDRKALDTTQIAAWLIGGVPSIRLARLVAERGLATLPTHKELRQLESVGAGKDLLLVLNSGNVDSARIGSPIPAALLKAAERYGL
jgi:hypothetical protein